MSDSLRCCEVCQRDLGTKRRHARFCSGPCKAKAHRRAHPPKPKPATMREAVFVLLRESDDMFCAAYATRAAANRQARSFGPPRYVQHVRLEDAP